MWGRCRGRLAGFDGHSEWGSYRVDDFGLVGTRLSKSGSYRVDDFALVGTRLSEWGSYRVDDLGLVDQDLGSSFSPLHI